MNVEKNIMMLPDLIAESEWRYVAFHKNEKGNRLAKAFQEKFDELKSEGFIEKIIDNWQEQANR